MDFTRKARWVLDGHKTPNATISTYAGVVSRESVRIAFTYAALNGLDICAADIRNTYLQAPSSRKDYIVCGSEFGLVVWVWIWTCRSVLRLEVHLGLDSDLSLGSESGFAVLVLSWICT